MAFDKNASALLREAVAGIAPKAFESECPVEALTERQDARIRLIVARKLFGKAFPGNRELDRFLDKGDYAESSAKKYRLSQEMLPLDGIGEDSFFLNEYYGDGTRLSSFATLLDWDKYSHERQEGYHVEEGNRPDGPRPYDSRLLWDWSRWLDDGHLVYGNLSVASSSLEAALDEYADDLCRERYKTQYVEGPEHGKRTEGGGYRWDMVETPKERAAIRFASDHVARVIVKGWMEVGLRDEAAKSGVWVSRIRRETDGELNEDLIFSGPEAMDRVRFRHWKADLSALDDGTAIYAEIARKAKDDLRKVMEGVFDAAELVAASLEGEDKTSWKSISEAVLDGIVASRNS
jgi:hypothetical protein